MQREKKTEIITLRVTPQTKERIRAKAQELSLTVTDYLCLCGLGKKIVRVDGLDWQARADILMPKGAPCKVTDVDGAVLIVCPVTADTAAV